MERVVIREELPEFYGRYARTLEELLGYRATLDLPPEPYESYTVEQMARHVASGVAILLVAVGIVSLVMKLIK